VNVFKTSATVSPLAGAIAGCVSTRTPGIMSLATAVALGLMIGLVLYLAAMGLAGWLLRVSGVRAGTGGRGPLRWLASIGAFLAAAVSPVAAWVVSAWVVSRWLHL
jgi:hypothetical protein